MDDKNVYASSGFLNEIFILNELDREIGKNLSSNNCFKEDTSMFSFEFEEGLVFDYGYTIKLLLTN